MWIPDTANVQDLSKSRSCWTHGSKVAQTSDFERMVDVRIVGQILDTRWGLIIAIISGLADIETKTHAQTFQLGMQSNFDTWQISVAKQIAGAGKLLAAMGGHRHVQDLSKSQIFRTQGPFDTWHIFCCMDAIDRKIPHAKS